MILDSLGPALSTIRMPTAEIGRVAAQSLLTAIHTREWSASPIALQPTLVPRMSTAAPGMHVSPADEATERIPSE